MHSTPSMKHYKFIAKCLSDSKPEPHWDANKMAQWQVSVNRFIEACIKQNPKFDKDKFLKACRTS